MRYRVARIELELPVSDFISEEEVSVTREKATIFVVGDTPAVMNLTDHVFEGFIRRFLCDE